ncbi:Dolichyl-phosphate-mannose--protein mannosyltransferase 1 [Vanrija albida]|uniref:Dolichyl-phosphate-mannose--protein mannosyltransferase n=1 Tax=Vanrija albida TaxID=181172 RepID=A0ABR3Q4U3_9TREE
MPALSAPQQRRRPASPPGAASLSGTSTPSDSKPKGHANGKSSSGNAREEADADARLRNKDDGPVSAAFGGPRLRGAGRAGAIAGLRRREWILVGAICVIASFVRLWNLAHPTSVVFDEVHFGGFAAKYIKRKYFMDVHPPLAKLLVTLSAFIGRFDGNFDFKDIGKDYIEPKVPYVVMRSFPAILGLAVVPITFLTLIALRLSLASAILGALLVTFDNALVTQSRLILLDSYLVFFTALTIYFWVRFSNDDSEGRAFTTSWWRNLALTGASLGAVASCKWVGLFTIATIGLGTIRQLWLLLGNLRVTPQQWARHFAARTLCLIVIPIFIYMWCFQIHFWILNMSGDGDGFMSSELQHTLEGHGMDDTYADVGLGSTITIRHVHTQGGYLHSHAHAYPAGSKQQQITLYPHRDSNNNFRIVNASVPEDGSTSFDWDNLPFTPVTSGLKVRFEHIQTNKRLHSHDVRPPVSEVDFQNEVSGYGFDNFAGDANDDFILEIVPQTRGRKDKAAKHRLRTLRSQFRLRHAMTGCYLFSHKVKLPDWGFEQQEVTCNKNPTWENSLWFIETNSHPQLAADAEKVNYEVPSFFSKFWELQGVMWRTNAGLTDRHAYDSRPQSWPWLRRGINFWVKDHTQVYLIGNPIIWWSSSLAILAYVVVRGFLILRAKRGYRDLQQPKIAFYDEVISFLLTGWALHYFPFFLMQRQLFLHHYLPALWFAILIFATAFDYATSFIRPRMRFQIAVAIVIIAIWSYNYFSPLTYASPWTKAKCEKAKWLQTWDFSCGDFYEDIKMYHPESSAVKQAEHQIYVDDSAQTTIVDEAPEPIKNAFDGGDDAAKEEKTTGIEGPNNDVKMQESTAVPGPAEDKADAPIPQDDRAPVGLDAGALEVTGSAHDEGGWHGGANDDAPKEEEAQPEKAPAGAKKVEVEKMDLDDDAKKLADEALRAADE